MTDSVEPGRPTALAIEHLIKRFGAVAAVNDISLELGSTELMAVVGPSGCGKSTLLRTVAGLVVPDSGRIVLNGTPVDDGSGHVPPERRGVGLVFQDHALFPHLTVRENVAFGIRDGSLVKTRVPEMLDLVSLPDHGDRYPHELSGGERQRVALARALAPGPKLMLFDEPFASIDHNLRVRLRADVVNALRATGTPALFVTHDQPEALAIGDRVAVLRRGRLAQIGSPETVFHKPSDTFVARFMGDASFLPIDHRSATSATALGPIDHQGPDDGATVSMVRPDDLRFRPEEGGNATVRDGEYRGSDWLLTVEVDGSHTLLVAASHLEPHKPGTRGRVELVAGHRQVPVTEAPSEQDDRADRGKPDPGR